MKFGPWSIIDENVNIDTVFDESVFDENYSKWNLADEN
jgi:hypothetical protein